MKLISILLCILFGVTFAHAETTHINLTPQQAQQLKIVLTSPEAVTQGAFNSYAAEVMVPPAQTRVVTSAQAGLLDSMKVSLGQTVRKGQVIAHIASPDLVGLQSDYLQTLTKRNLAANALNRDQALFNDGIIPQRRLIETQSSLEALSAALAEKKQALALAGMGDGQIKQLSSQRRLNNGITIVAPISGQVIEQHAQVGARIDISMPLYTIAQLHPLWLNIQVPVEQGMALTKGTSIQLPKLNAQGEVNSVLRQINKNNQTVQVLATLNGNPNLAVGQVVQVSIQSVGSSVSAFKLPSSAIAKEGNKNLVFVQTAQGYDMVPVAVIDAQALVSVVTGQLNTQSRVAVSGIAALKGLSLGLGSGQ